MGLPQLSLVARGAAAALNVHEATMTAASFPGPLMTCSKQCIAELDKYNIEGNAEPYIGAIRFGCLHHLPVDEIVLGILVAHRMLLLVAMLSDGDELSPEEKKQAVQMLRQGKSAKQVFEALRPGSTPKLKKP